MENFKYKKEISREINTIFMPISDTLVPSDDQLPGFQKTQKNEWNRKPDSVPLILFSVVPKSYLAFYHWKK